MNFQYQGAVTGRTTGGENIKDSPFRKTYVPPQRGLTLTPVKCYMEADFSKIEERLMSFLATGTMPPPPMQWPTL